ncbi:peptidoglycan DD-metalloendopeptidase family protein [Erysipelothrix inopinata]|uniref:Peptidoglycan DD-metalloendopeptidase family protein n=1 Tax=Erysipelothrix inopinata TaxID=225084 RepID=A0A7G9RXH6_9FIRM|nr:M23 family metallopeptidase [Erysipelothrix inopinata]QNN60301.1 peptidoglycan DD-metalloendopeptidase family protein [Erysipelothrix inopinata]
MDKILNKVLSAFIVFIVLVSSVVTASAATDSGYVLLAHMSDKAVSVGTKVKPGTVLGTMGMTGNATVEHVHVEYTLTSNNEKHNRLDPKKYINIYQTLDKPSKILCDVGCYTGHKGVDMIPSDGSYSAKVISPVNGVVVESGVQKAGWGNYVRIRIEGSTTPKPDNIVWAPGYFSVTELGSTVQLSPSESGKVVRKYKKDYVGQYDGYIDTNGYRWLTWTEGNQRVYMAQYVLNWSSVYADAAGVKKVNETSETGYFTVSKIGAGVQVMPSEKGKFVRKYQEGYVGQYDGYFDANGYRWLTWKEGDQRVYMALYSLDWSSIYADAAGVKKVNETTETGYFTVTKIGAGVQVVPSEKGKFVRKYQEGYVGQYDGYFDANGYRWLTWKEGNQRVYMALYSLDWSSIYADAAGVKKTNEVTENGTFTVTKLGAGVQVVPSEKGQFVRRYQEGQEGQYDGYFDANGYRWVTWKEGDRRVYMAIHVINDSNTIYAKIRKNPN